MFYLVEVNDSMLFDYPVAFAIADTLEEARQAKKRLIQAYNARGGVVTDSTIESIYE
jgi:hypothetical protein